MRAMPEQPPKRGSQRRPTNPIASATSLRQASSSTVSSTHSFIGLPFPASKDTPSPVEINSATRAAGSLTTSWLLTSIAKIDLLILIAFEPNPVPPSGTLTPDLPAYSSQSNSNSAARLSLPDTIYFSSFDRRQIG